MKLILLCLHAHFNLSMVFSKYLLVSEHVCRTKKKVPMCTLNSAQNELYSFIIWDVISIEMDFNDMSSDLGSQDE